MSIEKLVDYDELFGVGLKLLCLCVEDLDLLDFDGFICLWDGFLVIGCALMVHWMFVCFFVIYLYRLKL